MSIDVYVIDNDKKTREPGRVVEFVADKGGIKAIVVFKNGTFAAVSLDSLKIKHNFD